MRKKPTGPSSGVLIKAAMDYDRLGWSVIPVQPQDKEPLIRWQVFQHRRPAMTEIGDWFTRWPNANLAIVTGIVSALVVLELDPGSDGDLSCARLEREHGPLPQTVEAESSGGERHLYFAHPGGMVRDRRNLAPGIDLRSDGGFVLAPPSVHASGFSYRWIHSPEVYHIEPLPAWLLTAATDDQAQPLDWAERWENQLQKGIAGSERDSKIVSLIDNLLSKGVDPETTLELALCWNSVLCHPPLEAGWIARAVKQSKPREK